MIGTKSTPPPTPPSTATIPIRKVTTSNTSGQTHQATASLRGADHGLVAGEGHGGGKQNEQGQGQGSRSWLAEQSSANGHHFLETGSISSPGQWGGNIASPDMTSKYIA